MVPLILAAGAALGVGGLGLWILNRAQGNPANVTTTTVNPTTGAQQVTTQNVPDMWTYWNSLSSSQQAAYRSALWTWVSTSGAWPASMESAASSGITSLASLSDGTNLSFATDAYQSAHPGVGTAEGQIDAATFASVTSGV